MSYHRLIRLISQYADRLKYAGQTEDRLKWRHAFTTDWLKKKTMAVFILWLMIVTYSSYLLSADVFYLIWICKCLKLNKTYWLFIYINVSILFTGPIITCVGNKGSIWPGFLPLYSTTKEVSGHFSIIFYHCIKSGANWYTLVSFSYVDYRLSRKPNKIWYPFDDYLVRFIEETSISIIIQRVSGGEKKRYVQQIV